MKKIVGIFAIALLGGLVALGINLAVQTFSEPDNFLDMQKKHAKFASQIEGGGAAIGFDFVKVSEVSTPAVVHIKSHFNASSQQVPNMGGGIDPFELFRDHGFDFNMPQQGPGMAAGSGVIITQDGYIVTNNHVIDNASKIEVTLNDKRTFIAEVIGVDKTTDLALLKIDEEGLRFMSFGNSDNCKVGEWVLAVGNPMNLTSTVTAGIISAKGRSIDLLRRQDNQYAIENFIQTDAAINPGNSGGALVNTHGQLIGINTAIASQTGSYTGYGFAVPVNLVKKVMDDLLKFGKVQRALLGVAIQDITQDIADKEGLKDLNGVLVKEVTSGSSGDKAGVKQGDVITKINSVEVNSASALQEEIGKFRPGDKITIEVKRAGELKTLNATLKGIDGKEETSMADNSENNSIKGLVLESLSNEDKDLFKVKQGVKVAAVNDGPFKDKIKVGFVITKIDKQVIYSIQTVKTLLSAAEGAVLIEGKNADGSDAVIGLKVTD